MRVITRVFITTPPGVSPGVGYGSLGFSVESAHEKRRAACVESVLVYHLMQHYRQQLSAKALSTAFSRVEMPTVLLLANMELNGFGEKTLAQMTSTLVMPYSLFVHVHVA